MFTNLLEGDAELFLSVLVEWNFFRPRRRRSSGRFGALEASLGKSGYWLILLMLIGGRKLPESLFEHGLVGFLGLLVRLTADVVVIAAAAVVTVAVGLLHGGQLALEAQQEVVKVCFGFSRTAGGRCC